MAPWLGHVMVADQESSRPLLDASEICKLIASDMILLVAGYPPIRARRFRYYEHPEFAARANLPVLQLNPKGPYPFRPRQHANPWPAKRTIVTPPDGEGPLPTAAPAASPPDRPAPPLEGSELSMLAIPLPVRAIDTPGTERVRLRPDEVEVATIDEQLDLLISDDELMRRRALDELERVNHHRPHGVRHHIPL